MINQYLLLLLVFCLQVNKRYVSFSEKRNSDTIKRVSDPVLKESSLTEITGSGVGTEKTEELSPTVVIEKKEELSPAAVFEEKEELSSAVVIEKNEELSPTAGTEKTEESPTPEVTANQSPAVTEKKEESPTPEITEDKSTAVTPEVTENQAKSPAITLSQNPRREILCVHSDSSHSAYNTTRCRLLRTIYPTIDPVYLPSSFQCYKIIK